MRRQKFKISIEGNILKKWKTDGAIISYIKKVKERVINPNLLSLYNYDAGLRNISTNDGYISNDQWPHYNYSDPNKNKIACLLRTIYDNQT